MNNILVYNDFIFKTTFSGLDVFNSSFSKIDYIHINNIRSIGTDSNYLYVGTATSGIYNIEYNGIGDHTIDTFKSNDYFDNEALITLSVCGDYKSVVTTDKIYLVDQFSYLYDHSINNILQTCDGDFYYTTDSGVYRVGMDAIEENIYQVDNGIINNISFSLTTEKKSLYLSTSEGMTILNYEDDNLEVLKYLMEG